MSVKCLKQLKLKRFEQNPILSPNPMHDWESLVTTNPGAWYDEETGKVMLLYRAAGNDAEHVVRLALATSEDGYHFQRHDTPFFSPSKDGFDAGCVEDPRIVNHDGCYLITYATRPYPPGEYWLSPRKRWRPPLVNPCYPHAFRTNSTSTGLLITHDFRTFIRAGRITDPTLDDRDVVLFPEKIGGEYYMMHRPMEWVGDEYGTVFPSIWIAHGEDLLKLGNSQLLVSAQIRLGDEDWRKHASNTHR